MNWDDVRIFLALARCGRLSEAGKRLDIDHSTVARRVASLEKAMGAKLFDRQPSGYQLTSSGEELLQFAQQMEATAITAESVVADQSEQLSGPVRVAAPEGIAAFAVAAAAKELCEAHPRLQVQVLANSQRYSLSKREADFMVSVSRPKTGRLKIQKIADVMLHLYATEAFLDQHGPINSLSDLKAVDVVSYVPELIPDKELDYLQLLDLDIEPRLTSTSVHVQSSAILAGAGVGIMHDFMAEQHPQLIKLLVDEISITRTLWGVVHLDHQHVERISVVSKAVVDHIRRALRH